MMDNIAVRLSRVSKKYVLHHEKPTLVENIFSKNKPEEFWALKNINLNIYKGERIGIVGPNGSGKTTLLEIIAGISVPTEGSVVTQGKVSSLIGINAGFNPDLTGEENLYLNALLTGMSRKEIDQKFKQIATFSEVGDFLDAPLYTYSSGMKLRLGFSIAIHTDPSVLLIDEVFSVGDEYFKKKSQGKIKELINKGCTLIVVSHNLYLLKDYCKRVVVLQSGKIVRDGKRIQTLRYYEKSQNK